MDLISVIMPFFRKKEYFQESFNSVLNQSYNDIEIIIIYDDENKNDLEFLKKQILRDKRARLIINQKNLGVAKSRNIAIEKSNGKYIAFLDCDDNWKIDKLKTQYTFMLKNNLRISHTSYKIINDKGIEIGQNNSIKNLTYNELIKSCDIGLSTVMLKKEVLKKSKFKDLKTKEDYALWLELARNGEIFSYIEEPLTCWRRANKSLSSSFLLKLLNGFRVYYIFEKKNLFMSIFLVINLGINYLKKRFKQLRNI